MSLTTLAAEQTRDLPVDPFVFGGAVIAVFAIAMIALLMFGKGRPHT